MAKRNKKCSECGRLLANHNKSGLCSNHYRIMKRRELNKKRKEKGLCISCGEKVNPKIVYPDGMDGPKEIKYLVRCYKCRKKRKK